MSWLERLKPPKVANKEVKVNIPAGIWAKCTDCGEILYQADIDSNFSVCPKCSYHYKITARQRIAMTVDEGTFIEHGRELTSEDPLHFKDSKRYKDRVRDTRKKTSENSAFLYGEAMLGGHPLAIGSYDFQFMGGSMGSVVGEKITRTLELALEKKMPAVVFSCSGGARMQEGILSLMQMAKTCAVLGRLRERGVPFISVLTDPTTGGVAASYAMLGDITIAEPKALIGFAGPRVIEQTIRQKLPEGFQKAEFLFQHGMVDMIVHRKDMASTLATVIGHFC